jgi:photosystem I subunit 10
METMMPVVAPLALTAQTSPWSPLNAVIILLCTGLAYLSFKSSSGVASETGPVLGMTWPEVIGVASFGHLLGVGVVLGLSNIGVL